MNETVLKRNWNVIKGRLGQKYPYLTDKDLVYVEGKEEELIVHIHQKIGCTRDELLEFIDEEAGR